MIQLLPLTLLLFTWNPFLVDAGSAKNGQACTVDHQRLQIGTYQFMSDCDSVTYCNKTTSTCMPKGCRKDEFPYGYDNSTSVPDKCDPGNFCPDEGDACQPLLAVGSACQFNRDDQCEPPSDWKDLADTSGYGLNVNGSVCLNNICMWANVTVGLPCVIENTGYTVYSGSNEYVDIVSRGNCRTGLYCDAQSLVCMQSKAIGETCDADKECLTFNCQASGVCGKSANKPSHVPFWVYIIVGICIFGGMFVTLIGMYCIHRRHRNAEREKRLQYWREQNAFRQNILQMQETARHSIMTLPRSGNGSPRDTLYSREGVTSEDSQMPMLAPQSKSSALRHQFSDDGFDGSEESIMIQRVDRKDPNRF